MPHLTLVAVHGRAGCAARPELLVLLAARPEAAGPHNDIVAESALESALKRALERITRMAGR